MPSVCDYCFKEPTLIDTENGPAYYFVMPKESGDMTILMTDLEFRFRLCADKEHPVETDEMFICQDCFCEELDEE